MKVGWLCARRLWSFLQCSHGSVLWCSLHRKVSDSVACFCRNGPLLTEWALMEVEEGNTDEARGIFARGAQGSPHAPLLTAWADLEQESGRCACATHAHAAPSYAQ